MIFAQKYDQANDTWLIAIEIPMGVLPNEKVAVIKAMVAGFHEQLKFMLNIQPEVEEIQ